MVGQRQIKCMLTGYIAAFIGIWMPNTLLALDCSCNEFGFGVCIRAYSCPSSGVDEHFLSSYAPELVERPHPRLHGVPPNLE